MTVRDVYELALVLIDEDDDDGRYLRRCPGLLRIIGSEISRVMMSRRGAGEPDSPDDEVGLPDEICESVAVYALAAQLLLEEDPARASFFEGKYEEELAKAVRRTPGVFEEIENVYGSIGN